MNRQIVFIILFIATTITVNGQAPNFFGKPPIKYEKTEFFGVQLKVSPENVQTLLPSELKLIDSTSIHISFSKLTYDSKDKAASEYYEVGIAVTRSSINDKEGPFINMMYVDQYAAKIAGREIWGFPKVNGEITFEKNEKEIKLELMRFGKSLIKIAARLDEVTDTNVHENGKAEGFILKTIPSVTGDKLPVLKRINSYVTRDGKSWGLQKAEITSIVYSPSLENYLPNLGDFEVLNTNFSISNGLLDYGKVEYDYLKK